MKHHIEKWDTTVSRSIWISHQGIGSTISANKNISENTQIKLSSRFNLTGFDWISFSIGGSHLISKFSKVGLYMKVGNYDSIALHLRYFIQVWDKSFFFSFFKNFSIYKYL